MTDLQAQIIQKFRAQRAIYGGEGFLFVFRRKPGQVKTQSERDDFSRWAIGVGTSMSLACGFDVCDKDETVTDSVRFYHESCNQPWREPFYECAKCAGSFVPTDWLRDRGFVHPHAMFVGPIHAWLFVLDSVLDSRPYRSEANGAERMLHLFEASIHAIEVTGFWQDTPPIKGLGEDDNPAVEIQRRYRRLLAPYQGVAIVGGSEQDIARNQLIEQRDWELAHVGKASIARPPSPPLAGAAVVGNTSGPADASVKAVGMSVADAAAAAERHVRRNSYPGVRALAKLVGCASSTMSKAIPTSKYLKAQKALHEAGKVGKPREVQMSDATMDQTAQEREPDALDALISEQEADEARDKRQHRAARRDGLI